MEHVCVLSVADVMEVHVWIQFLSISGSNYVDSCMIKRAARIDRNVMIPAFVCAGKKFEDIRRHYRDCVIVGYSRAGADAVFDPVDSQVLTSQDKLIMLSYVANPTPGPESTSTYRSAAKAASERMARPTTYQAAPRKVIVAGWNCEELQDILECFADAAPDNSQITFVLRRVPEDPSPPSRVGNVRFSYIQSDHPTSIKALNVSVSNMPPYTRVKE